jgi:hypothetical protein
MERLTRNSKAALDDRLRRPPADITFRAIAGWEDYRSR